jgi:cardiolipin-specific phospholipase
LEYSGLKVDEEIRSVDVTLSDNSWMHEVCCGFDHKEHIVLLHGYGGCALTFIRLFAGLSKQYFVHALDHMGMGLSGRRVFSDNLSQSEMVDYFIDAMEEWRIASGIDKFILAGHSFGGYIAAAYSVKYPKGVSRLALISPVGTKFSDKDSN